MKIRREIDGLRALAVVPVVFFHAGLDVFSGGFIGVDVFFVISGYLITYLILEELSKSSFSLVDFYERRARRILPALFVVMAISTIISWFVLLPSQMQEFAQSLGAVTIFLSNVFFHSKSGYFSSDVDEKPMLHTWSLAVEEQFYIIFPLMLMALYVKRKHFVYWVLIAITISSFLLAEYLSRHASELNFYIMPTRAWELLLGSMSAYFIFHKNTPPSNSLFAATGLFLILLSIFFIDESVRYPSVYTLPAVVGTCLIITFSTGTVTAKLLSLRALVFIGLISYSAYLWHQPLLAFARVIFIGEASLPLTLSLGILAFIIAWVSYLFIETPFRNKASGEFIISRKRIVQLSILCSTFFLFIAVAGHVKKGFPQRFSLPSEVAKTIERSTNAYECFDLPTPHKSDRWGCDIGVGNEESDHDFLVWGDSHLLVTYNSFVDAAKQKKKKGFYTGIRQCTPFLGIHALRFDQGERNCHLMNKRVFSFVKKHKIPKIILVSRWSYYSVGGYSGDDISFIGTMPDSDKTLQISRAAYLKGLSNTIDAYSKIGTKILVLEQVPHQKVNPEEAYFRAYRERNPKNALSALSVSREAHLEMQSFVMIEFAKAKKGNPNVEVIPTTDVFCDHKVCHIGDAKNSFYYDEDHVSVEGSKLLTKRIKEYL